MFKELVPILRHRAVLMTVILLEEDEIRVNVVPKKLKDGDNDALSTPLSVTGTAEELDAQLSSTLVNFAGAHLQLKNTLEKAKAEMDAAAKTAQAEARSKNKTSVAKSSPRSEPTKADETTKPAPQTPSGSARTASLFDASAPTGPATDQDEEEEIFREAAQAEQTDEDDEELDDAA